MKRDPVSLVWVVGLALAVLFYALDPGRVAEQLGAFLSALASQIDYAFAQITFAAADVVRAAALGLFAVFVALCLLSIRRGGRGRAALRLGSAAFLFLVVVNDAGPDERRWGEALLLAGTGALIMTRRVRSAGR